MNTTTWLFRSLRFHRRMHLALAGGAALATAVLAAALLTGDALNRNLQRIALERVGSFQSAVELRGRFVDAGLADRLAKETGAQVAPVLRLSGSMLATASDGAEACVDRVNAYGVDDRFLAAGGKAGSPFAWWQPRGDAGASVLLSRRVQDALGLPAEPSAARSPRAAVSLRVEQPSSFPVEMPLGDRHGDHVLRRPVQVAGLLPDARLGRFALTASQVPPLNVFASRVWLADEAGVSNRVNLLLSDAAPEKLEAALRRVLLPSDMGVRVTSGTGGVWLVSSDRIYLDEACTRALAAHMPAPVLALHHLIDAFAAGEGDAARETPYGFLNAESPAADARLGVVPANMKDDEIVINAWLAEKLHLRTGDALTLRWRRFESGGRLVADAATFRVLRVIDMATCAPERSLLPRFPGLSDVDRCADWDIGMTMDQAKLNDPDNETYWKAYGPTPKAFVTQAAGRLMLGTHFGSAMTVRFPPETDPAAIQDGLRKVAPKELGLVVRSVRQEALQAAGQAMDFRQLFAGMAMVLMISALILTGLIASLGVAHRREEVGVLRAAGFTPRRVAWLWLAESLPPLAAGVLAGMALGIGGARLLLWALNRFWSSAVASAQVPFTVGVEVCMAAGAAALAMSLLAVYGGVRRALQVQVRELLGGPPEEELCGGSGRWTVVNFAVGMVAAALATVLLAMAGRVTGEAASGIFFGAGLLLMISLLCFARLLAGYWNAPPEQRPTGMAAAAAADGVRRRGAVASGPLRAGVLNVARHRGRSLLVMTLLATGSFLTVGTLSMKQDPSANLLLPGSGGGGFNTMVELSMPVAGGRGGELIHAVLETNAVVLPFRVHEGDEAGCLNLNHALQPRLLGVAPEGVAPLRAFEQPGSSAWALLQQPMSDDTIPVLAGDETTVEYGLQAQVGVRTGSVYEYAGEDGTVWRLRVVGALPVRTGVLQGSLLVDERTFTRMYPSAPGHGLWLVRSALPEADVSARLRHALGRNGAIVTPVRDRLRLLGAVESTYLDMFLVLGGLGVVLGAAGVGLVVLRNAAARRGELAVLRAVGVPPRQVLAYLMVEYVYVLLAGLAAGVVPALVAVQPAMRSLGQGMPVGAMAAIIAAMMLAGLLGTCAAVQAAARMPLMEALRGE